MVETVELGPEVVVDLVLELAEAVDSEAVVDLGPVVVVDLVLELVEGPAKVEVRVHHHLHN